MMSQMVSHHIVQKVHFSSFEVLAWGHQQPKTPEREGREGRGGKGGRGREGGEGRGGRGEVNNKMAERRRDRAES